MGLPLDGLRMPQTPDHLVEAMRTAWNRGQADEVISLASGIAGGDPAGAPTLMLLGMAQQQSARFDDAVKTFTRLACLQPSVSAWWNNLGVVQRHAGDLIAAEQSLAKAAALAPEDAGVQYNLGLLYLQRRRWSQARVALLDAAHRQPEWVDAHLQAAHACHVCGDVDGEEAMLTHADAWPPQPAAQALLLASTLAPLGRLATALRVLDHARLPDGPAGEALRLRISAQRVALYERNNRLEDARMELRQLPLEALEGLPADSDEARIDGWRAHAAIALREGRNETAAALHLRALDLAEDVESKASAAFGLAAARDRQGHHAAAWDALGIAHTMQMTVARQAAPELCKPDSEPLPLASQRVSTATFNRWQQRSGPDAPSSPIFVIGFPRSGTTLLEQMLDAHPGCRSMDERGYVYQLIERMQQAGQRYPDDLATLGESDTAQLRAVYQRLVAQTLPDLGARRLIDKNPLNMLCLPMIARLFPGARIILCVRHPCDVLLSCYMQAFRSPAFMVLGSSLGSLAAGYAKAFEQCCWHIELFGLDVLEWRYESVVTDFDHATTRLGQYLDIADTTKFAGFATHARDRQFIATPSYAQVTQPVHTGAIGRWLHYREHFEAVLPILRPWLERFGYTA